MRLINSTNFTDERIMELFERQHRGGYCDIKQIRAYQSGDDLCMSVLYRNGYKAHCVWFRGEY